MYCILLLLSVLLAGMAAAPFSDPFSDGQMKIMNVSLNRDVPPYYKTIPDYPSKVQVVFNWTLGIVVSNFGDRLFTKKADVTIDLVGEQSDFNLAKTTLTNVELKGSTLTTFTVPVSINLFLETELSHIELTTDFLRRVSINKYSPDWRFYRHMMREFCIIRDGTTVRAIPLGNDDANVIKWKAVFEMPFARLFGANPQVEGKIFTVCLDGTQPDLPLRDPKLAGARD